MINFVNKESESLLSRLSHRFSTAAADPGMSAAVRSLGLFDVLSNTPAEFSVAPAEQRQVCLVSMPVYALALRNPVRNAGNLSQNSYRQRTLIPDQSVAPDGFARERSGSLLSLNSEIHAQAFVDPLVLNELMRHQEGI